MSPKKRPPRNAFYFFMQDFRDDQKAEGITYRNLAEVAEVAAPAWKELPAPARKKYEDLAKMQKNEGVKYTSIGLTVAEFEQRKADEIYFDKKEHSETSKIVKSALVSNAITHTDFFIMDVNVGCRTTDDFIICEMTFIRFNIIDGLQDCYHEIINPGRIPLGYTSDMKLSCQEMGLDMPDESKPVTNYKSILANIISLLKASRSSGKKLPPIFTMPDKVEAVEHFIIRMCIIAQQDVSPFRVYKLHRLFYYMMNGITSTLAISKDEYYRDELHALSVLLKEKFKYYSGIACQHHEDLDMAGQCTTSRAKGCAYMILEKVCPALSVNMRAVRHMPPDVEPGSIVTEFAAPPKNKMQLVPEREKTEELVPLKLLSLDDNELHPNLRRPNMNYALECPQYALLNSRPLSTHQAEAGTRPESQQSTLTPSSMNSMGVLGSIASSGSKRLSGIGRGRDISNVFNRLNSSS